MTAESVYGKLENVKLDLPAALFDPVERPAHYASGGIECIDCIRAALGKEGFIAFCRGNAIKYTWRADGKGNPEQDLRKAKWYANRAADELVREEG